MLERLGGESKAAGQERLKGQQTNNPTPPNNATGRASGGGGVEAAPGPGGCEGATTEDDSRVEPPPVKGLRWDRKFWFE